MNEVPIARGLMVCEQLIVDHYTRNVSLINCFERWPIDRFPSDPQRFSVYAVLTNGSGSYMMRVAIVRLDDLTTIYERLVPQEFSTPGDVIRFHLRVTQCTFPQAGSYAVQLFAGNDLVTDTTLIISSRESNHE